MTFSDTSDSTAPPATWWTWRERLATHLARGAESTGDPAVRRKAALVVMDDLAAATAGHTHAEVRALVGAAVGRGGPPEATLMTGARVAREHAAAINAAAAAWDELDEGYRPATCHGGLYTVPAVVAEAEATGASVAEVLAATVVGYEVVTAYARALPPPRPLVLHPHATLAPIGAAAGLTWLRTRDAGAVLRAADVASTFAMAGPFGHAVTGAQVRNAWPAAGATLGFLAADAAHAGLLAEGDSAWGALRRGMGNGVSEEELHRDFGDWAILDGYHKIYAACQYTHSALEAALEVREEFLGDRGTEDVRSVVVETHPLALPLDSTTPGTSLAGKFSVPHVVAAVLVTGRSDPTVFDAALLDDPQIARLRRKIRLTPYEPLPPAPHDRPARLTVTREDGSEASAQCLSAVGGPDRPLEDAQVLDKITRLTTPTALGFGDVARRLVGRPEAGGVADDGRAWRDLVDEALQ